MFKKVTFMKTTCTGTFAANYQNIISCSHRQINCSFRLSKLSNVPQCGKYVGNIGYYLLCFDSSESEIVLLDFHDTSQHAGSRENEDIKAGEPQINKTRISVYSNAGHVDSDR